MGEAGLDQDIRWIARHPAPGDLILHDVEGTCNNIEYPRRSGPRLQHLGQDCIGVSGSLYDNGGNNFLFGDRTQF